jgi:hypothetical protein
MTQTEVPTPSAPQLDYAPAPSVVRSRWFRRIVLISVLLAIVIGSWKYGGPILSQVRVLWWQRTCMTYAQPADRVVYTDTSDEAAKLQKSGEYLRFYSGGPAFLRDLPAYQGLSAEVGYAAGSGGAIAFMHERTDEKARRRMVVVYVDQAALLKATVYVPATATSRAKWVPARNLRDFSSGLLAGRRIFAGQPDPNDPSAFTIRYDAGGIPRTVRGQLLNDYVVFSVE